MNIIKDRPLFPIAMLLLCAFFINSFTSSAYLRIALTCLAIFFSVVISFASRTRYRWNWPAAFLVALWAIAVFCGNNDIISGDYSWIVFFSATLLVTVLIGFGEANAFDGAIKMIASLGLFFALATIAMWVFPPLFDIVKEVFFSSSVSARSYRSGFTAHYSTNAIYITYGIICAFALLLFESNKKRRLLKLASVVTCFFALLLTTKRTHLVIAIVACMSMYLLSGNRHVGKRMAGLLVWVSLSLVVFSIASQYIPELSATIDRIAGLSDDDTFGGRSDLYSICSDLWEQSPIIGNGWGSFSKELYSSPAGMRFAAQGYYEIDAHNVFLQLLAESGVVGFCLFALWSIGTLLGTGRLSKAVAGQTISCRILSASWGLQLFFLVYCFTGNPLYDPQMYIPCLLVGFGGYLFCWNTKRREDQHEQTAYSNKTGGLTAQSRNDVCAPAAKLKVRRA